MGSRYDDELWELVPQEPGPPPAQLVGFVRGLGGSDARSTSAAATGV